MVENPPASAEYPLEKEMAIHLLPGESHGQGAWWASVRGCRVGHNLATKQQIFQSVPYIKTLRHTGPVLQLSLLFSIRKPGGPSSTRGYEANLKNGNPLQYSCLENPMDGGAWQASPWGRRVGHD